jgi:hypothetical protein
MSVVAMVLYALFGFEGIFDGLKWLGKGLKRPNLGLQLQRNAKRIRKIEEDGKAALQAIRNLHETKKKLNEEFRADWDKQFRLLLPPPQSPQRKALTFKYTGERHRAFRAPQYEYRQLENDRIWVDGDDHPIPVGAIEGPGGHWWFGFNNLPGYGHELLFIRVNEFKSVESNAFWAFMPTIRETRNGEYRWEEKKAKVLANNIMDTIRG